MIVPCPKYAGQLATRMRYDLIKGAAFRKGDSCGSLPTLRLYDPPLSLVELLEEVDHASPKQVIFFDSRPLLGGDAPHAVNWVDSSSAPDIIPVFLNPRLAMPEIVAHELGHVWIEFYLGFEDHRRYAQIEDEAMSFMVDCVQSHVLDCVILELLERRGGFDLSRFYRDIVAAAFELIQPLDENLMHGSVFTQILAAGALAIPTAFPDLYRVNRENREILNSLWKTCWRNEPRIASCAQKMVDALNVHGYRSPENVAQSVDGCLGGAFEFLNLKYDPVVHMVPRIMEMEIVDKMPDFAPGLSPRLKHRIVRDSVLRRRQIAEVHPRPDDVYVEFAPRDIPYSALNLPRISRPAPLWPTQYTKGLPFHVPNSPADIAARTAGMPGVGIGVHTGQDINVYERKYEFTAGYEELQELTLRRNCNVLHG